MGVLKAHVGSFVEASESEEIPGHFESLETRFGGRTIMVLKDHNGSDFQRNVHLMRRPRNSSIDSINMNWTKADFWREVMGVVGDHGGSFVDAKPTRQIKVFWG